MKVLSKVLSLPIQIIAAFDTDGNPTPSRFKITSKEPHITVKIDKIISKDIQQFGRSKIYIFRCQSVIDDLVKTYELKFDVTSGRWVLFKM